MGSHRRLLVGLLTLVTAVAFEQQGITVAMPAAAVDLGQLELYAWAFTAFIIPQIVAIVWAGRLSDAVGPVRPLSVGVAVFAVGLVVSALAPAMPVLLLGRFVQGFGGGLINCSVMVLVGRAFPPELTPRVMTWISTAWVLPSLVGPAVAAALVTSSSWHAVFWAVLPLAVLGAAVLLPPVRALGLVVVRDPDAAQASLVRSLVLAVGVVLLQAAGQRLGWWSVPLVVVGLAFVLSSIPGLMPRGWRPLADGLASVIAVRALMMGGFFGQVTFLALMLVQLRGLPLGLAGFVVTLGSLGWTAGSWLQSRPWLALSRDQILTLGASLVALGLAAMASATWLPGLPLALVILASVTSGLGMGLGMASTMVMTMQLSPQGELGRNTSAIQLAEATGNAIVAGLAGTLFAAVHAASGGDPARFTPAELTISFALPMTLVAVVAALAALWSRRIGHVPNLARPRPDGYAVETLSG